MHMHSSLNKDQQDQLRALFTFVSTRVKLEDGDVRIIHEHKIAQDSTTNPGTLRGQDRTR